MGVNIHLSGLVCLTCSFIVYTFMTNKRMCSVLIVNAVCRSFTVDIQTPVRTNWSGCCARVTGERMRDREIRWQCVTLTFAQRFRLVFSLSGFANLSTKITTKREFRSSFAERKHLAILLSENTKRNRSAISIIDTFFRIFCYLFTLGKYQILVVNVYCGLGANCVLLIVCTV